MIDQNFLYSGMNIGGWQKGPKKSTQRRGEEYRRSRIMARAVAKAKQTEFNICNAVCSTRPENTSLTSSRSRGLREEVNNMFSGLVYREGTL